MYLSFPTSSQCLEVLVVLSTAEFIRYTITSTKSLASIAESKAGRIRPDSMPSASTGGTLITRVHGLATFIPPLIYIGVLPFHGFRQPEWITRFTLSNELGNSNSGNLLRAIACLVSFALRPLIHGILEHLGDQWHTIGRREKSRVVKTGPYAYVRHPAYSSVLLQEALWSIMFWSYIPLVALGITASAFAVKMPIEEELILKDDIVREEYRQYMKDVPGRILPGVW